VHQQHHNMESTGHCLHAFVIGPATFFVDCGHVLLDTGGSHCCVSSKETHCAPSTTQLAQAGTVMTQVAHIVVFHRRKRTVHHPPPSLLKLAPSCLLFMTWLQQHRSRASCQLTAAPTYAVTWSVPSTVCAIFSSRHPGGPAACPVMLLVCFCGPYTRTALTLGPLF
jgi:hypothetical protein